MKQLLKVWLVMGWALNLFASEANPTFLALDVLNTPATKDLVTIIQDQRTSSRTKVNFLFFVVNGLTFTDQQKRDFGGNLYALRVQSSFNSPTKVPMRANFSSVCSQVNTIIRNLGVTQAFLPVSENVGLSRDLIVAAMAFIHLIVGRFFASDSEQDEETREDLSYINVEKIIKAYAP